MVFVDKLSWGALLVLCTACGKTQSTTTQNPRTDLSAEPPRSEMTLVDATPEECPAGGSSLISYIDLNSNGVWDEDDELKSRTKICNGYGSGIEVSSASAESCGFGGAVFKTFVDRNQNGILDGVETATSLTTICNGSPGNDGADGEPAHLSVRLATPSECASGGHVYTSSYGGQDSPDVSLVCNGSDGQDGTNGRDATYSMGAVGEAIAGKFYSACHHDYLYFPNSENPERGWLSFRHQGNGAFDQGIGSTGFQVWNVDIRDFSLASEKGNVVYCTMQWDAASRRLEYEVVDPSDGLAGTRGSIEL